MVASGYQKALLHWVLGSKFLTPVSDLGSSWPSCLEIFDLYVFGPLVWKYLICMFLYCFKSFFSVSTFFLQIKFLPTFVVILI